MGSAGALEALLELLGLELTPDPPVAEVAAHAGLVRDPKDIPVAFAAIAAKADCLVSTDQDLADVDDTTVELRGLFKPVAVGAFLHEAMGWSRESLPAIERRFPSNVLPYHRSVLAIPSPALDDLRSVRYDE